MLKIQDMILEERPREKFSTSGPESLNIYELLALLLGNGTRNGSVMEITKAIVTKFNPVSRLLKATINDLTEIHGIGKAKAMEILAAVELGKRIHSTPLENGTQFLSAQDIYKHFCPKLRGLDQEEFHVALLDNKHRLIKMENIVSRGTLNSSLCHPREIFKAAIENSACSIFCVHNHPSGDPSPSQPDILITQKLFKAGEILGIQLLDHVIIGDLNYFSMRTGGYL